MATTHYRLSLGLGLVLLAFLSPPARAAEAADDKAQCTAQLKKIYQAIQEYRKEHKELPKWLSDLKPQYLGDADLFVCPVQRRTGEVQTYAGMEDPEIKTSYSYEFCDRAIPANTWGGDQEITMRIWKGLQMAAVGGKVPMVRCFCHGDALNLSFDGEIWDSELTWEQSFADVIEPSQLSPRNLMARFKVGSAPEAEAPQLDLTGFWVGEEKGSGAFACVKVQDDQISFYIPEKDAWYRGTFTLNTRTSPTRVAFTIKACPSQELVDQTSLGIVRIVADTMTLAAVRPGAEEYPSAFESSGDCRLFEFRRRSGSGNATKKAEQSSIPERDSRATARQINLSPFCNVSLNESWHNGRPGNTLAALPAGLHELDGTSFDVRGVVQVSGPQLANPNKSFPQEVTRIPVNLKTARLHFLHGAGFSEEEGVEIGKYIMHYAGGETETMPIVYGQTVRDWWYYPDTPKDAAQSHIAWTGSNEAAKNFNPSGPEITLRLYKTTWANPHPDSEIASIDFVSEDKNSSPFLIAITAD